MDSSFSNNGNGMLSRRLSSRSSSVRSMIISQDHNRKVTPLDRDFIDDSSSSSSQDDDEHCENHETNLQRKDSQSKHLPFSSDNDLLKTELLADGKEDASALGDDVSEQTTMEEDPQHLSTKPKAKANNDYTLLPRTLSSSLRASQILELTGLESEEEISRELVAARTRDDHWTPPIQPPPPPPQLPDRMSTPDVEKVPAQTIPRQLAASSYSPRSSNEGDNIGGSRSTRRSSPRVQNAKRGGNNNNNNTSGTTTVGHTRNGDGSPLPPRHDSKSMQPLPPPMSLEYRLMREAQKGQNNSSDSPSTYQTPRTATTSSSREDDQSAGSSGNNNNNDISVSSQSQENEINTRSTSSAVLGSLHASAASSLTSGSTELPDAPLPPPPPPDESPPPENRAISMTGAIRIRGVDYSYTQRRRRPPSSSNRDNDSASDDYFGSEDQSSSEQFSLSSEWGLESQDDDDRPPPPLRRLSSLRRAAASIPAVEATRVDESDREDDNDLSANRYRGDNLQERLDALERRMQFRSQVTTTGSTVLTPVFGGPLPTIYSEQVVSAISVQSIQDDDGSAAHSYRSTPKYPSEDDSNRNNKCPLWYLPLGLCVFFGIVGGIVAIVALSGGSNDDPSVPTPTPPAPTIAPASGTDKTALPPTLTSIRERGFVRCYTTSYERRQGYGFSLDLCRAIAAAIFEGDATKTEFPDNLQWSDQWPMIANGQIDISTNQVTYTMERDVFQPEAGQGMAFSSPWLYTGTVFTGRPDMVTCAEAGDTLTGVCSQMRVCVVETTTTERIVRGILEGISIVPVPESASLFTNFASGNCNVLAGEPYALFEGDLRDAGYTGDYGFGSKLFSKEPLAMVTREDDVEFAQFVEWILQALITAEAVGITQSSASAFPSSDLFGDQYLLMFQHAIAAVGNYGEMYDRSIEERFPRSGMNQLKTIDDPVENGGLMYALPFGNLQWQQGASVLPLIGNTLEQIKTRGIVVCGVLRERPWLLISDDAFSGLDVEYCRAISAAIFGGSPNQLAMIMYETIDEGLEALHEGLMDVFCSTPSSIYNTESSVRSGVAGLTLSPAYFYDDDGIGYSLATRADDVHWSDFIKWILISTIYAEEEGLTDAADLPTIDLFGPDFTQMFRFVHLQLGHYGDIYNHTQGDNVPRSNINRLNTGGSPRLLPRPEAFGL